MLLRLIVKISGPDANGKRVAVDSSSSSNPSKKKCSIFWDAEGDNGDTGKLTEEKLRVS